MISKLFVRSALLCALLAPACAQDELPPPWTPYPAIPGSETFSDALSAPIQPTLTARQFSGSQSCKTCHSTHFEEWQSSPHSRAMRDPIFQGLLALQRTQELPPGSERFCVQCHSPIALRAGDIASPVDFAALTDLASDAVTCEACHRATHSERPFNAGLVIAQGGVLRGPLHDADAPHPSAGDELFTSSTLCASCHDVEAPNGLKLETPYAEWLESPAAAAGDTCQSCHMPEYAGRATSTARERDALHRHTFSALAHDAEACTERGSLCGAAELSAQLVREDAGSYQLQAQVTSRTLGHSFPTGSTFFRQVWLAVEVRDADDRLIFESGQLDERGDLFDLHAGAAHDPQLQSFHDYLVDEHGDLTQFPWQAVARETHGLKPNETRAVSYRLPITDAALPVRADVRLRFRTFAPRLLRSIEREDLTGTLELVDVDHVTVAMPKNPIGP